jgi:hypothetical protein
MLPVTGKFRGIKLDHFTRFYLKLAGKTAVFSPCFFKNQSNVLTVFFKLQFSSKNRHFPLNFFLTSGKLLERFPGPVCPYRSQFGGLIGFRIPGIAIPFQKKYFFRIFFVVYIDF